MPERRTTGDHTTLANINEFAVTALSLDLRVDFEASVLTGSAEYRARAAAAAATATAGAPATELVLDTRQLTVFRCEARLEAEAQWREAAFRLDDAHAIFGSALRVTVPAVAAGGVVHVRVTYQTSPESSALCWLKPEQTDGGRHPYLFSQCQAIHARSMVPCQDTPGRRFTYQAKITAPKELTALMSALAVGEPAENGAYRTWAFEQKVPIPSYLLALVVGHLESRELGPRSRVWSEPSQVEAGAYEFAETEKFVAAGEELLGEYVWGRYDVLLLPGSFPFGGMENPCLTFVTPTLIAGDRSLADVIAHEVAHSWTGNLVGPQTWEDFWLNEGFTMYVQRAIVSRLHGEELFDFDAIIGWNHLHDDIEHYGKENPLTALRPNLHETDPDDAFCSVPYEKGFNLLYHLQGVVGGKDAFRAWLRDYIQTFRHQSITSGDFKAHLLQYFDQHAPARADALRRVDWATWFDAPGMPPVPAAFSTRLADACRALGQQWLQHGGGNGPSDIAGWRTTQILCFLDTLLQAEKPLAIPVVAKLDAAYDLSASRNAEVLNKWLALCLKAGYPHVTDLLRDFITRQGRMKFVRPLYRLYFQQSKADAQALFRQNRHKYHNIAQKMLAKDLELATE